MLTSIPVAEFVAPKKGSRAWNAVSRALDLQPRVDLIGEFGSERFYRVKCEGRDRHCVIIWHHRISDEDVAKCDCEAHYVPHSPQHCYHIAAALIEDAKPRKLASMGRKEPPDSNGTKTTLRTRRTPRQKIAISTNGGSPPADEGAGHNHCPV